MYKGDLAQGIDKIGKLAELMGTLRGVPRLAAIKAQTPILRAVQEEFVKGQDPYGRPWAPLRPATLAIHGPPPLSRTLALAVDTDVSLLDGLKNGLAIALGEPTAIFTKSGFGTADRGFRPVVHYLSTVCRNVGGRSLSKQSRTRSLR